MSKNIKKAPNRGGKGLLGVDSVRACPLSLDCGPKTTRGEGYITGTSRSVQYPELSLVRREVSRCQAVCEMQRSRQQCRPVTAPIREQVLRNA